jgi:hypothetical protein
MKRFAFLLVVVALLLAACKPATPTPTEVPPTEAPPTEVPPTEVPPTEVPTPEKRTHNLEGETITLYHMGDITGPYGPITLPLVDGFNDAVAWLNAQGGIRRATVEIGWADTGGQGLVFVAFGRSFDAELDGQGRVLIPARCRRHAALDGPVIILGRDECLEVWNRQRFEAEDALVDQEYGRGLETMEERQ